MGRLERVPRPAIDVLSATIIRDSYRYRHRKVSSSVAYGKKRVRDVSGPNSYLGNTRSAGKISQILSIYLQGGFKINAGKIKIFSEIIRI